MYPNRGEKSRKSKKIHKQFKICLCDFPKETAGRFLPSGCFERRDTEKCLRQSLLEELEHALGLLVGLREHRLCRLCDHVDLGVFHHHLGHIGVADTAVRGLDVLGFSKCCTIRSSEYQCFVRTSIVCANDTIICCIAGAAKQNIASFQLVSVTCLIRLNRDIAASHSRICCRSRIKRRLDRIRIQTASICGSTVTICVVESECSRPAEVRLFRRISNSRFSSAGSRLLRPKHDFLEVKSFCSSTIQFNFSILIRFKLRTCIHNQRMPDGRGILLSCKAKKRRQYFVYCKVFQRSRPAKDPLRRCRMVMNTGS